MHHQPLQTEKYLVDRSDDPYLRKANRKRWTVRQVRRYFIRAILILVVAFVGISCVGPGDGKADTMDARLINLGRVICAMVGELNQVDKIMNSI